MSNDIIWTGVGGCLAVIVIALIYAWWPRWRYSWTRAKHLVDLTQTEEEVAPEYGWATRETQRPIILNIDAPPVEDPQWFNPIPTHLPKRSYKPFEDDYRMGSHEQEFWRELREGNWRTQTFDSLSPESLDSTSNDDVGY